MKKRLLVIMLGCMLALTGCGKSNSETDATSKNSTEISESSDSKGSVDVSGNKMKTTVDELSFDFTMFPKKNYTYTTNKEFHGNYTYDSQAHSENSNSTTKYQIDRETKTASIIGELKTLYDGVEELTQQATYIKEGKQRYTLEDGSYLLENIEINERKQLEGAIENYLDKLNWTLKSQTSDEFIFECKDENEVKKLLEEERFSFEDFTISEYALSLIYDRNLDCLSSISVNISGTYNPHALDDVTGEYTFTYDLAVSDVGTTEVVIPEEVIANAIEE